MVRLQEETQAGMYDLILHVGDFAYDLDTVCLDVPQWRTFDDLRNLSGHKGKNDELGNLFVFV